MKKVLGICTLVVALLLGGGCTVNNNVVREQSVDSDFERLPDGTLILSGNVDEDTFKEFYRHTSDGKDHYTLNIMTNGGCAYNTVAIMNRIIMLKKQGVKFTMIVGGHGFSAGAYIFMMGDERIMYRGSNLMWHMMKGQMQTDGNWNRVTIQERKSMLERMDNFVVNTFRKQFPHIKEVWIQETFWNSGMSWMTCEQALLMGIATKIMN